jgi:hypothetical protein
VTVSAVSSDEPRQRRFGRYIATSPNGTVHGGNDSHGDIPHFHRIDELINVASEDTSQLLQTALSTESNDNSHGDIPHFPSNLQNTLTSLQKINAALPTSPRDVESSHSFDLSYDEGDRGDNYLRTVTMTKMEQGSFIAAFEI